MRRLLALTTLALLVAAAPAGAAAIRVTGNSGKAHYESVSGEKNRLVVQDETTTMLVTENGSPLTAGDGCTQVTLVSVRCAATKLKASLGDGDDSLSVSGATAVDVDGGSSTDTISGGDGDDVIAARDGGRDVISCGGGSDTGEADFDDEVAGDCEGVIKSLAPAILGDAAPPEAPGLPGAPAPTSAPLAPVPGKSFAGSVKSGRIDVVIAGRRAPFDPAVPIPAGATIDASAGTIALTTASDLTGGVQTANFTGGSFAVVQKPGPLMVSELRMRGGDFSSCGTTTSKTTARAASKRKIRRLWGSGKGRFRTRGRNSAATVRGTIWSVTDRCDGTLTRVERGVVVVEDFKRKRSKVLRKGQSYLARR